MSEGLQLSLLSIFKITKLWTNLWGQAECRVLGKMYDKESRAVSPHLDMIHSRWQHKNCRNLLHILGRNCIYHFPSLYLLPSQTNKQTNGGDDTNDSLCLFIYKLNSTAWGGDNYRETTNINNYNSKNYKDKTKKQIAQGPNQLLKFKHKISKNVYWFTNCIKSEAYLAESLWLQEQVNMEGSHICSEQEQEYWMFLDLTGNISCHSKRSLNKMHLSDEAWNIMSEI